ncbi:MAG: hypothetical protein LLF89_06135 [Spirochaetaceae bacterium]|nr:hypothetical protein [Spirochaetaceae bacterium]
MSKGKKPFIVLMSILILALASCTTGEESIPEPATQPVVTTTTTVQAPAPVPAPTPATPVTTVAPAPTSAPVPSITEYELRNLYGTANSLRNEAMDYDLASVVPDEFKAADDDFAGLQAEYNTAIDAVPYDGEKAYPLAAKLEKSVADWTAVKEQGLPRKAEAEADKATDMQFKAMGAEAQTLAPDRIEAADELMAQADAFVEVGDYEMAIPAYKQTAAAYDATAEKANANSLREKIFSEGYAKYDEAEFQLGEDGLKAEESLWDSGSVEDLNLGADTLREANKHYGQVIATGAEKKALEAKDSALAAKDIALAAKADTNAPEEYASASDILSEAFDNYEKGNFESSTIWFGDAAEAFTAASDATMGLQTKNEEALAAATDALDASQEKSDVAGIEKNVYLDAAKKRYGAAQTQYGQKEYADSTANANEVLNLAGLSDNYVDAEAARQAEAEQKAAAAAKADADPAMADARTRMAWADANNIKADYAPEYKQGSSSMKAAELAYGAEKYDSAKSLAGDVSSTFSDEFMAKVAADRKAADEEAARKAQLELAKADARASADTAMTDAKARMNWAEDNEIGADYPSEYETASGAMASSELAYGTEDYVTATDQATVVSSTLSDEFKAKVAADRQAAVEDQANADLAMADARTRMAWADANNIKADYAPEYKQGSSSMKAAELAYSNERYVSAKSLAGDVSTTFSDEFMAKVAADRKAAAEKPGTEAGAVAQTGTSDQAAADKAAAEKAAADKLAADKAEAQAAIARADEKLNLAIFRNAENNFPAELVSGKASLEVAKKAFDSGDYATATTKAGKAYDILAAIPAFAPLPATYTVRLIPGRRDCLWRIAEYSFVYNNPLKWSVLYNANKATFRDPSNPDLIFPGQILDIPSISGETREGAWDSNKTYQPLSK